MASSTHESATKESAPVWHKTACILCTINCGLQVQTQDGHLKRIKGDKSNPRSKGYTCEKQAGLDHYQNHNDRIHTPMRRNPDGSGDGSGRQQDAVRWRSAAR
ncbi:MAG TPA: hypothetical protein EYQ54_22105 [Myxococcales bacterium]|nr:hypothetical protein [Myxococcales bacterium]